MVNKVNKNFLKSSHYIYDLKLCSIRMIDNSNFPWIIIIPKRKSITDITDLKKNDRNQLMEEIVFCSNIMKKVFKTSRLNVEKIGNIVPQLHIHIIARKKQIQLGHYLFGSLNQKITKKRIRFQYKENKRSLLKKKR